MLMRGFLIILAIVGAIVSAGKLAPLELRWLDAQSALMRDHFPLKTPQDIVVVGIDDASLKEFGVPIATLHRQIGQFLAAMAVAHPRAVGFDMVLPETSYDQLQPGLDAALARGILMMRTSAPLVLGIGANDDGSPRPLLPLFATVAGAEGQASVFVLRDQDGIVRRFDERIGINDQKISTLVGQLARRLKLEAKPGLVPVYWDKRFGYYPLHQVLALQTANETAGLQAAFAGKVVLLGSLLAHDDLHRAALSLATSDEGETTHGVFIHAVQLRSLMAHTLLQETPQLVVLLIALVLTLTWWLRPSVWTWLGVSGAVAALYIGSLLLLRQQSLAIPAVTWSIALLSGISGRTGMTAWQSAAERRLLRNVFGGFVSPGVMNEILAGRLNPNLAGERREICVLFSDIRGFTTMSEHLDPQAAMDLLNRYFERMATCVHHHDGTLDKFIGDGMMAFFGAPQTTPNPCDQAFRAAQEMLVELEAFNLEQEARNGLRIAIGIGLHYGPASIGYIGSKDRHEYSAIGDTVNTSSRLEGLTKDSGYQIVMSGAVVERLSDQSRIASLGERPIKGRAPMELFGWRPQTPAEPQGERS